MPTTLGRFVPAWDDGRALPRPERMEEEATPEPSRNPLEQVLAEVWSEVLQLDTINVYDNFFDLGGHSLLALKINLELRFILPVACCSIDCFLLTKIQSVM